jgi:hypothetical protein
MTTRKNNCAVQPYLFFAGRSGFSPQGIRPESTSNPLRGCNSALAFRKDCLMRASECDGEPFDLGPVLLERVRHKSLLASHNRTYVL